MSALRRAAVLVCSDRVSRGLADDRSGPLAAELLRAAGWDVVAVVVVADDAERIAAQLRHWADEDALALIVTSGGTGFGPRDVTPEATLAVLDREAPGMAEAVRAASPGIFPMLSRGRAGQRAQTLIVNLPGSTGGVRDGLATLVPALAHAADLIAGGDPAHPVSDAHAGDSARTARDS